MLERTVYKCNKVIVIGLFYKITDNIQETFVHTVDVLPCKRFSLPSFGFLRLEFRYAGRIKIDCHFLTLVDLRARQRGEFNKKALANCAKHIIGKFQLLTLPITNVHREKINFITNFPIYCYRDMFGMYMLFCRFTYLARWKIWVCLKRRPVPNFPQFGMQIERIIESLAACVENRRNTRNYGIIISGIPVYVLEERRRHFPGPPPVNFNNS